MEDPSLPKTIVLKLFDRRFMERMEGCEREWCPNVEQQLRTLVTDMAGTILPFSPPDGSARSGTWDDSSRPQWMDEVKAWERGVKFYARELRAYRALHNFQGVTIPQLFGTTECLLSDLYRPQGLALEYIEGDSVNNLRRGVDISSEDSDCISQAALDITRQLRKLGILHNDIRSANVVIRSCDARPFLIDFGHSEMHEDRLGWSTEKWRAHVEQNAEIEAMRVCLAATGFHLPTPTFAAIRDPWRGHSTLNRLIEEGNEQWRQRYWIPLNRDGPEFITVQDREGKEHRYEFQRWELKPGVRESLYDR